MLLTSLLAALTDPSSGKPHFGEARFSSARFPTNATFNGALFSGITYFHGAHFNQTPTDSDWSLFDGIGFAGATFVKHASFDGAEFSREVNFNDARFSDDVTFDMAQFSRDARFERVQFTQEASFNGAEFSVSASFNSATFSQLCIFRGVRFNAASFREATFSGASWFERATLYGPASFSRCNFSGPVDFSGATFSQLANFSAVKFSEDAKFGEVKFTEGANFNGVEFSQHSSFECAEFAGDADFTNVQFYHGATFEQARFSGEAQFRQAFTGRGGTFWFNGAQFESASWLGPLMCGGVADLSGAVFRAPITLEIAAGEVRCERTQWESTATIRLRADKADLRYAVLAAPMAVTTFPIPFRIPIPGNFGAREWSPAFAQDGRTDPVRVMSVQGVDAAFLVLTDVDLSDCQFFGAFHLDQIRLEGRTVFPATPDGWHRRGIRLFRWTPRRTLAEEHHWRALEAHDRTPQDSRMRPARTTTAEHPFGGTERAGTRSRSPLQEERMSASRVWRTGPEHPDPGLTPDPEDVAALYRQLRKAFEDGKNEPGAADFYYGECEMRRHDRTGTSRSERGLLWAYWLLSGYGLRASRALGWLAAAMITTIVLLMGFGLPEGSPKPQATGSVPPGGGKVTLTIDKEDPKNPSRDRFTGKRFDKALSVTLNSVVFRSSGQDLTTAGSYIEMTSRLFEPALLAFAVLAIRGRIKR
ncbi:pentapeptide repeat-containing protein [Streptomyces sp. NPDC058583]|uniref:pentapeptide repeat-containing protein n=1 Tax=unclassified Streptomyces TaxID=2593676 RepID=UPI0036605314